MAIMDDQARIEMRGDFLTNCYSSYFDGFFDGVGQFTAMCLSMPAQIQQGSMLMSNTDIYHPIRVRPINIHGFILPDPCTAPLDNNMPQRLAAAHPIAFSDRPAGEGERPPVFGDILSCTMASTPKGSGKIRSIRYLYPETNHVEEYTCANKFVNKSTVLAALKFKSTLSPGKTQLSSLNQPLYNYDILYEQYYYGTKNGKKIPGKAGRIYMRNPSKKGYTANKTFYDRYDDLFVEAATANGVEPALLKALSYVENRIRNKGCSEVGACGIVQFMPATAREMGLVVNSTVDERNIPEKAIHAGARYLKKIYNGKYVRKFSGIEKWAMTLAAYNTGIGNVQKYGIGVLKSTWHGNTGQTGKYVAHVFAARDYFVNEQGFR